jgi:hypothetical protein
VRFYLLLPSKPDLAALAEELPPIRAKMAVPPDSYRCRRQPLAEKTPYALHPCKRHLDVGIGRLIIRLLEGNIGGRKVAWNVLIKMHKFMGHS